MLRGVSFEATAQGRGISRTGSRNFGTGIASVVNQTLTLTDYRSAELTAIGCVGGQDVVVGVQHDCWQSIVLKVGNQS
jgi:hypothetical protein